MDFMKKHKIKLGYAPTRREVFSREDAGKHRNMIAGKLKEMGVDFVDIEWLNDEALLYEVMDAEKVAKHFIKEEVDALFIPHCNFGTEGAVGRLAKILGKPVLLWGPRDDQPLENGYRTRDSQCGLFATSKVLQRFGVPFTYITNSTLDSKVFENGFDTFLRAASVVKAFRGMRIGQISTRPDAFLSVMVNEGELLEKFGIEIVPTTITDLLKSTREILERKPDELKETLSDIKGKVEKIAITGEALEKISAVKLAIRKWAEENQLSAVAIQCWYALQKEFGVFPCFINGELTAEGLPIACETDINGAITAVMAQAAGMGQTSTFFADITVRSHDRENVELLWHCGPFPHSLKEEGSKARIDYHYLNPTGCPGVSEWEIKGGDITVARFDGINGRYSLLMGHGKGTKGSFNRGTFVWTEFKDWPLWEEKLIYGPYNHHCVGIHGKLAPALYEACRYIPGLVADPVEPDADEIRKSLRTGE